MASSPTPATNAFRAFLADDWRQWLTEYPELATSFGSPGLNGRWTDDSPEGIDRRKRHLAASLASLKRLDPDGLPPSERTSYDLYRELLETAERGLPFGLDPLPFQLGEPHNLLTPLNQMEGVHLTAADILEIQPRERLSDYDDILSRLEALPRAVEQNLALLEAGRAKGYVPHRVAARGAPDQVRGLIPSDPMTSPLLRAFSEFPAHFSAVDRERLVAAAVKVYQDRVAPAFHRLHDYLVATYLPACRDSAGVSSLPNGAALYTYLVRTETTTELTPREIHEIGLGEVRRLRSAMEELMHHTGFSGTYPEFLQFLRTDDRFFYSDAESLVDGYRIIAKKIDPGLARRFGRLPRLPYGVQPVPAFRAKSSTTAYYMPGAPATGRPGMFFANTFEIHSRPRWEMEALTLHEAVPGHHLQIALAQELDDLPDFRKFTGPTAFVEGWGLYAESLGEEFGLYQDPYSMMGKFTYDLWRSIRLVVDTGIHALGWTRDDAIRFFRENAGKADNDIAVEVDRYIVWPGQALAYKVGQLKIRQLRTEAERALGQRFDVRGFHDCVLAEGAIPLGMLESRVKAWVAARAAPPDPSKVGAGAS
ncbi:MAG: DUF885 domain-containing protein [Thermoplasmata archaeon]